MGRGLVIGSTRLFAAADHLLESAPQCAFGLTHPAEAAIAHSTIRTRAFTAMELSEAGDMLVRMGLLSRSPVGVQAPSETI